MVLFINSDQHRKGGLSNGSKEDGSFSNYLKTLWQWKNVTELIIWGIIEKQMT